MNELALAAVGLDSFIRLSFVDNVIVNEWVTNKRIGARRNARPFAYSFGIR
jgi:hypothetical protein